MPEEYRRILWLIDTQGDMRAIRVLLQEHPEHLVRDWLRELEDLRFLESKPRAAGPDRTFPPNVTDWALSEGRNAVAALSSVGAYLSPYRPVRPPSGKPAEETTVLIVEDDPDQLSLADLRVSSAGYRVRTAMSVAELMRSLVQRDRPDLLLLDAMLPDGSGFDVLSDLRRNRDFATLPIVMLTVVSDAERIAQGLASGADGYVTKPYSKHVLVGVIRGILG